MTHEALTPLGIEYWPRYSIVLFRRYIVDLDVLSAMVRPSDRRSSFKCENCFYSYQAQMFQRFNKIKRDYKQSFNFTTNQIDPMLRIQPNLLTGRLIPQGYLVGIYSPAVAWSRVTIGTVWVRRLVPFLRPVKIGSARGAPHSSLFS